MPLHVASPAGVRILAAARSLGNLLRARDLARNIESPKWQSASIDIPDSIDWEKHVRFHGCGQRQSRQSACRGVETLVQRDRQRRDAERRVLVYDLYGQEVLPVWYIRDVNLDCERRLPQVAAHALHGAEVLDDLRKRARSAGNCRRRLPQCDAGVERAG